MGGRRTPEVVKPKIFAERLSRLVEQRKLQQNELAARVGKSPSAVTFWMRGRAIPQPGTLRKLADELGVTVDFLLGKTESPWPDPVASGGFAMKEDAAELLIGSARRLRAEAEELERKAESIILSRTQNPHRKPLE